MLLCQKDDGPDGNVILWNYADGLDPQTLVIALPEGNPAKNTACIFTKDGHGLLCGWSDGTISFWDFRLGRNTRKLIHDSCIVNLALSRDGSLLASSSKEFKLCIWTVAEGYLTYELCGHSNYVEGLAFTNDGTGLISSGNDGRIILWDLVDGSGLRKWGSRNRGYALGDSDINGYDEDDNDDDEDPIVLYSSLAVL